MRFFRRAQVDAEMDEELRSHIQLRADDLERSGLTREEAERRARVEFGGYQRIKEESRDAVGGTFIESIGQDLRYALRMWRKSPGLAAVAIGTLALGIGANAVVFSVLNALILRPLNVSQAQNVYEIYRADDKFPFQSYPDYRDLRDRNRTFDGVAAYNITQAALDLGDSPSRSWGYEVTGNYFAVLGVQPYLWRLIHASDEHGPDSAPYVVLSHAFWHAHFQDDRAVVGRTVRINKHPFTVVGVVPPEFHGTVLLAFPDFYVPIVNTGQVSGQNDLEARGKRWVFMTIGRLKAGLTPEQAVADLDSIGAYLEKTYPVEDARTSFALARPNLIGNVLGPPIRAFMTALMLLAGLILLAACTNLGGLFAARAADRSKEVALRLALGTGRLRILRQLCTEALLIALVGGAAGLLGSVVLLRELSVWSPIPRFPLHIEATPDASVYVVAVVLTLACGFFFGAVPIRQVFRTDPYQTIKSAQTGAIGRSRITFRDLMLVAQIAICAVLVTSSLVAVRGLMRSLNSRVGFDPANAMLIDTHLDAAGYHGEAVPAMQRRMTDALATIPGVSSVGLVGALAPLSLGWDVQAVYAGETNDFRPETAAARSVMFNISPDYLRAAGTALVAGRTFSWHDDLVAPRVAIVNREFARIVFGAGSNAIGRFFKRRDGSRTEVVGVVEDGKYTNLIESPQPAMFLPILQSPSSSAQLVVRSAGDQQPLPAAIKNTLRKLDPGLPSYVQTWNAQLDGVLFPSRVATVSLGVLGAMGAMLSITGIFGMASYSVSKRLRELGIRVALGAERTEVLRVAIGRAFKLLVMGSAAGLGLGLLAARVLAFIVYQATPRDPFVLAGVVFAMLVLGLLATWIPARRALSIDPLILLRVE